MKQHLSFASEFVFSFLQDLQKVSQRVEEQRDFKVQ